MPCQDERLRASSNWRWFGNWRTGPSAPLRCAANSSCPRVSSPGGDMSMPSVAKPPSRHDLRATHYLVAVGRLERVRWYRSLWAFQLIGVAGAERQHPLRLNALQPPPYLTLHVRLLVPAWNHLEISSMVSHLPAGPKAAMGGPPDQLPRAENQPGGRPARPCRYSPPRSHGGAG